MLSLASVIGFFQILITLYPFNLEQTIILFGIIKAGYDALISREWGKLEKIVVEKALPLFSEMMSNEQKRDAVIKYVWAKMPATVRLFATADQVEKFVDKIYVTQVKPIAKRKDLVRADENGIRLSNQAVIDTTTEESIFGTDFLGN